MKTLGLLFALCAISIGLTGCGSDAESSEVVAAENPYGGFPIDPPAIDEVVLTVTGAQSRDYTMGELDELATQEVTILEPFVKQEETFRGVPLSELFQDNGIPSGSQITTIALNDYRYTDSVEAFTASNGLLAVSRDGQAIPMDEGGPIRIIFPEGTPYFTFLDAWNWSLRSIVPATGS
jgi:hypothetical protein